MSYGFRIVLLYIDSTVVVPGSGFRELRTFFPHTDLSLHDSTGEDARLPNAITSVLKTERVSRIVTDGEGSR